MVNQSNQYSYFTLLRDDKSLPEGARVMPFLFPNGTTVIDLENQLARNVMSKIQTLWVDNSLNDGYLDITFDVINLHMRMDKGQSGYFPLTIVNPARFTVVNAGTAIVPLHLINIIIDPITWTLNPVVP